MRTYRSPAVPVASLPASRGRVTSTRTSRWSQDTFRRFAENEIVPVAEEIHRKNEDIPEKIIAGLAELGAFGLSVPEEYGGFAAGGEGEYLAMVVATEELSRGSLGVGGSLITRPEILTRALVKGGTEEQKKEWLPQIASGEVMCAVAATEPDYGSDVAGFKVTATQDGDGYRINGVKTWCTFAGRADVLMLLARTDPDKSQGSQGTVSVHRSERARRGPRLRAHPGRGRQDGGPPDRHDRLPGHALLRGRARQLVRARREPDRRRRGHGPRLLPTDGGLRERPAPDRGPGSRIDAGRVRSRVRLRDQPQGVRQGADRVRADAGEARSHGRDHPGQPPVRLPGGAPDGQGRGHAWKPR